MFLQLDLERVQIRFHTSKSSLTLSLQKTFEHTILMFETGEK